MGDADCNVYWRRSPFFLVPVTAAPGGLVNTLPHRHQTLIRITSGRRRLINSIGPLRIIIDNLLILLVNLSLLLLFLYYYRILKLELIQEPAVQQDPGSSRYQMQRRQAIKSAAAVFAEKGFHGSSTRDIAEHLGIKQGSLYYYFGSKEEALGEV